MDNMWLIIISVITLINTIILIIIMRNSAHNSTSTAISKLDVKLRTLESSQERLERSIRDEMGRFREEMNISSRHQFELVTNQLSMLVQSTEQKLDKIREVLEEKIKYLQEDNNKKLEQMRITVDEKLHATLEQRLGESFKLVSERLEAVHKGLGEMQTLAAGVGDLKKVLTNVKSRGTWGEIQLSSVLEQVLSPEQYCENVITKKNSTERVEFALKLPGRDNNIECIWLPIDAKFPIEDYQRLQLAQEQSDVELIDKHSKALELRIKSCAKDIRDKYLDPPNTTDFAIMFLPTEGLYAEVLRIPGLCELLQSEYRIIVSGPTTLIALLNSLQMGFKTLAIEKRSSEVWSLLAAVKTEFGKFGLILDKTQKKLQEASNTIETAARKSRNIQRKLKNVEELPSNKTEGILEEVESVLDFDS